MKNKTEWRVEAAMELKCLICSNNCILQVQIENGEMVDVAGNGCLRGYAYAQQEVRNSQR